ncbi:hypothetical protein [Pollutibacter soli]|uniref:hypothetical protein n=1 Tax=Pollutibacter soli TaxID=3034157 RepID=UPI0030138C3C
MVKSTCTYLLLTALVVQGYTQTAIVDSLKNALEKTNVPVQRFTIVQELLEEAAGWGEMGLIPQIIQMTSK